MESKLKEMEIKEAKTQKSFIIRSTAKTGKSIIAIRNKVEENTTEVQETDMGLHHLVVEEEDKSKTIHGAIIMEQTKKAI